MASSPFEPKSATLPDDEYVDEGGDGYTALEIFRSGKTCQAFTYDDIILMPGSNDPFRTTNFGFLTNY